jgi:hypothetical protein
MCIKPTTLPLLSRTATALAEHAFSIAKVIWKSSIEVGKSVGGFKQHKHLLPAPTTCSKHPRLHKSNVQSEPPHEYLTKLKELPLGAFSFVCDPYLRLG